MCGRTRSHSPNSALASSCAAAPYKAVEGVARARQVVLEFKDYATALACYDSEEYQRAKDLRVKASQSDLVIVEGYDGPQPG